MLAISSSYPMALFCEMSRSIGMGDFIVLKDKPSNTKTYWKMNKVTVGMGSPLMSCIRNDKVVLPYSSGRIGSSSRLNIPWIPWQSSAGISVSCIIQKTTIKIKIKFTFTQHMERYWLHLHCFAIYLFHRVLILLITTTILYTLFKTK